MSWFHHTKLDRYKAQRTHRLQLAQQVQNSTIRDEFLVEQRTLQDGFDGASQDGRLFEAYFGEPLPMHFEQMLHLETLMWSQLQRLSKAMYTEEQYRKISKKLRVYLDILVDLLHAEEEAVTNCLVVHYVSICNAFVTREQEARPR